MSEVNILATHVQSPSECIYPCTYVVVSSCMPVVALHREVHTIGSNVYNSQVFCNFRPFAKVFQWKLWVSTHLMHEHVRVLKLHLRCWARAKWLLLPDPQKVLSKEVTSCAISVANMEVSWKAWWSFTIVQPIYVALLRARARANAPAIVLVTCTLVCSTHKPMCLIPKCVGVQAN